MPGDINARLPDLSVEVAATVSNELRLRAQKSLGLLALGVSTGTAAVEVSADGENWVTHPSGPIVDGEILILDPAPFRFIRLNSSAAQAGTDFVVQVVEQA